MNTKTDRELLIQCVEAFAHICMVWSDKFSTESQQRIAKWFEEVTAHLAAENVTPEPGNGKAPFGYVGYNKAQSCWEFESERVGFEGAEYVTIIRPVFTAPPAQTDDTKDAARLDFLDRNAHEIGYDNDDGLRVVTIFNVTGRMNDREWNRIGQGQSLRSAIDDAMSAERKE